MDRWRFAAIILGLATASGCGALTPRNFRAMSNPAPVVRAGAVSKGEGQPDAVAIPAWIVRLDDKDPVVRMAAHEELKARTGQDFGFVAWDEPEKRAAAVAKWKAWWSARAGTQAGLVSRGRKR